MPWRQWGGLVFYHSWWLLISVWIVGHCWLHSSPKLEGLSWACPLLLQMYSSENSLLGLWGCPNNSPPNPPSHIPFSALVGGASGLLQSPKIFFSRFSLCRLWNELKRVFMKIMPRALWILDWENTSSTMSLSWLFPAVLSFLKFYFSLFWLPHAACGILVHQPGIELLPSALETRRLNNLTANVLQHIANQQCVQYSW